MNNDTDGLNNQPKREERDNNVIVKRNKELETKIVCYSMNQKHRHKLNKYTNG